jgi:TonB dependent receptor
VRWDFGAGAFVTRGRNLYHRRSVFSPDVAQAFTLPLQELQDSAVRPRETGESLFAAFRPQLGSRFDAELGVRMDSQHFTGQDSQYQWSPRLNLRLRVSSRIDAYGSLGRFSQPQRPDEWRMEEGQQRADPAQLGTQGILGLSGATRPGTQWRIEVYRKRWHRVSPYFDNLLDAQSLTPSLAPDRVRISPQSSIANGAEFSVRRSFGRHVEAWAGYDRSHVTDNILGKLVDRSWDQRWNTNAGVGWTGDRFSTLATVRAHDGWPRTPVDATAGGRNSRRWGTYFEADLRAAWLTPLRSGSLEVWTEITNAGDRQNDCCVRMGRAALLRTTSVAWQPREIDIGVSWRRRSGD